MKHNIIVYIGRFQPAHLGHIETMRAALEKANRLVVVIGSHNTPRDIQNPWTAPEREHMIRACLTTSENERVSFVYAENRLYSNTFWASNVEKLVNEKVATFNYIKPTIAIIGNGKPDHSTGEYLDLFKKWPRVAMDCVKLGKMPLHATKLRELIFTGHTNFIGGAVFPEVYDFIVKFSQTPIFSTLKAEYDFHVEEEKKYAQVPYGSYTRYTADAVVIQSGHVLLINRAKSPGKGLWALPGGHVEQTETAFEGAIRELMEETSINLQPEVFERGVFEEKLFDHPERSIVGRLTKKMVRTATMAYGFKLDDKRDLPRVKSKDVNGEVQEARWFTFSEISEMRDQLFEDHCDIILYFLARIPE